MGRGVWGESKIDSPRSVFLFLSPARGGKGRWAGGDGEGGERCLELVVAPGLRFECSNLSV